jgi:hypothetical protein
MIRTEKRIHGFVSASCNAFRNGECEADATASMDRSTQFERIPADCGGLFESVARRTVNARMGAAAIRHRLSTKVGIGAGRARSASISVNTPEGSRFERAARIDVRTTRRRCAISRGRRRG